ncbi:uncharacterized protein LOC131956165 [Physella acuta]|uniref:uncharacterized protein LOC131956165 n=1 Tax=Physella acuta TaxID=109671 RepID=UPI0027DE2CAE|nr:uncharacterized protein LOC131956165 [Physella acuta]
MTQLLLVHGFAKGTNPDELLHLLQTLFDQDPIKNLWLDPWNHPRAVVEFERHFGNSKLLSYKQRKSFSLSGHQLYTEIEMPTSSVLARTNGVVTRSVQDKLSLLFTSLKHGGRKVTCVKQLGLEDWFEILFDQGWEAVLAVCNKEWILETNKLTVIPYFNCFIEPYECQYERLLRKINTRTAIDSELAAVGDLHMDDVSVLENYGLSRKQEHYKHKIINQVDDCSSEAEKKGNVFSPDTKTIYIYYDLNVIPLMLSLLNFEKALKGKNLHSLVQVTFESCEVKIKGPATLVQRLHEVLTPKHYKFTKSKVLKRFLALKKIQQDIKKHFENSDCHLVLEIYDDHLSLIVVDDKGNKGTFQEFMSQLVTEKTCLYLSKSDLDENKELLEYIENFNKTNSHSQIFNEDGKILLLILFYQDQLINCIAMEIKKVLNEKVKIQITFQSRFYIWLLDAMTFTKAAQKIFPDVSIAIDIDNHDINLNGYERQIDVLNKILVDQNEKISCHCVDETLFSDEKLLIKLKKVVEELGYHVDIIGNDNLKIVICNKHGNVDYLEKLVGKFIKKKTSYSFKNNTHLEKLAADINSMFQSFHVFVEEKKLILFAFQGYDKENIDKVTEFILSQNLGEYNVTQHQLAHINDEVENESEQGTKIQKSLDEETETSHNMKSMYKVFESEIASTSQSYNDQISLELIDPRAGQQGHHAKNTESTDIFKNIEKLTLQDVTAETFEKSTIIHYEQSVIPWILKHLNIEKALKETKFPCKVEVTSTSINIEGSGSFVKKMHKILSEKTFKSTKLSETCKRFLGLKKTQQAIKKCIKISGIHLVLDEAGEDIKLIVIDNQGNKCTVQEFISQLVREKNCLSSKNLIRNKELLEYIENFNSTNPHGQIFIEDGNVLLLSLFYQSKLMDSVASEIQKFSTTNVSDKKKPFN